MPQLGNTVEECLVTRWVKQTGDTVATGEVVAEIETDKTTFEVTSPVDGTVLATFFEEGALVPVFTNILVIGSPGESVDAYRPGQPSDGTSSAAAIASEPAEIAAAERQGVSAQPASSRPWSPRARRFAESHGFHPASMTGSGPGGRVIERDVRKAYEAAASAKPAAPSGLRGAIARRMRESLASTAQYTLNGWADATGLLARRAQIKTGKAASRGTHESDITINDLVSFCTIQALLEMPDLNAEFIDGRIVQHSEVHLAFAVDTPRGLLAPVVRSAHTLAVGELARRMKALTTQAVEGAISANDLSGATFTISNMGSLGIESFTPVINPPQVAILGVGAIQLRPVRREGRVEFVDAIGLSLTCDHQVIDGAPGARFLGVLRRKIESLITDH
jgi:pyruvate dehydrogenase E2 component (dihydrolipoamide acetyltransferase)